MIFIAFLEIFVHDIVVNLIDVFLKSFRPQYIVQVIRNDKLDQFLIV